MWQKTSGATITSASTKQTDGTPQPTTNPNKNNNSTPPTPGVAKAGTLVSSEVASLWSTYMNDSMSLCLMAHFAASSLPQDFQPILQKAQKFANQHLEWIRQSFQNTGYPIPIGFPVSDINRLAQPLFLHPFPAYYLYSMARIGLVSYAGSLSSSYTQEVRDFFSICLQESSELTNQLCNYLDQLGLLERAPYSQSSNHVYHVNDRSFLGSPFHRTRPLTVLEITHLHMNLVRSAFTKALLLGFAQTANDPAVQKILTDGVHLFQKHFDTLHHKLSEDFLPSPGLLDDYVSPSDTFTFALPLILFHTSELLAGAIGNYGLALGASPRQDIAVMYGKLMISMGKYAKHCMKFVIDRGWMEEPPMVPKRLQ
ncbi:DUF3231 family protein [Alicyclobacillus tolerans]|uniref:DUF3231 family protein n=1 Tax=Alicyclobacillus tolerans TaxID=90970 RepID=A0ABT9LZH4_9BACL|nr:DUF3231 family protein [Alicyclobacillus tengchongensis]MDP9729650.1 hypothetical protein [Alicyclobacillus tengchongensis]